MFKFRCLISLLVTLAFFGVVSAASQETHPLLNNAMASVVQVTLSPGQVYSLPKNQREIAWVALDQVTVLNQRADLRTQTLVDAGKAAIARPDDEIEFRATQHSARLIVVQPKVGEQELTVQPFVLARSLEDASDRNATLLIAISDCHFQDVRNLGDESQWIPGRPDVIAMKSGTLRWIRPGIHHFKNLEPAAARLVSVEW